MVALDFTPNTQEAKEDESPEFEISLVLQSSRPVRGAERDPVPQGVLGKTPWRAASHYQPNYTSIYSGLTNSNPGSLS